MAAKKSSSRKRRSKSRRPPLPLVMGLAVPALLGAAGLGLYREWDTVAKSVGLVDTPQSLFERGIDLQNEYADLLATIKTEADVQAKGLQIEDMLRRRTDLRLAMEALRRRNPEAIANGSWDDTNPRMTEANESLARERERIAADVQLHRAIYRVEFACSLVENERYITQNYENLKEEAKLTAPSSDTPLAVGTRVQFLDDGIRRWQDGTVVADMADSRVKIRHDAVPYANRDKIFARSQIRIPKEQTPIPESVLQNADDQDPLARFRTGARDDSQAVAGSADARGHRDPRLRAQGGLPQRGPRPGNSGNPFGGDPVAGAPAETHDPRADGDAAVANGSPFAEFGPPGFPFGPGPFGPNRSPVGPRSNAGSVLSDGPPPTPGQFPFDPSKGPPMPPASPAGETITVEVIGTISSETWESWCNKLQAIVKANDAPARSFSQQRGAQTKATLTPVKDLQAFADEIDFAEVIAVDEVQRVIQVQGE